MPQKLISFFLEEWISIHSAWKAIFDVFSFITCGAKLQNADWLRQRAFFLNHEGTFGNQQRMPTWCWLATKRYCRWNYFYNNGFPFRGSRRNLNFVSRMQFPQKFCPSCDKKVIASALWQLRINFPCIFKVFLKHLPSGPCDYIY